jgi:hypothetical protein
MSPLEKLSEVSNRTLERLYKSSLEAMAGLQPLISRGLVSTGAGVELLAVTDALRTEIAARGGYFGQFGEVLWPMQNVT